VNTPYRIVDMAELEDWLTPSLPVFADTETCGFYGKVRLLQVFQAGMSEVVMVEWPQPFAMAIMLNKYTTVWHNAHYDLTTVQQQTETKWVPEQYECTLLLARLAFPEKEKFSLDDVLGYVLGYDPYNRQKLNKKLLQKTKWDSLSLTTDQLVYAATDVYHMPAVWDIVSPQTDNKSYVLDKSTLGSCLLFQWNGMRVDKEELFKVYDSNTARLEELAMPINVNSWQQVRKYIDHDESDDLALATLSADGNERAGNVREARKLLKQNSFLNKFDTENDHIYGKFKPSARSGRLTSNDQNLQQIPRALKKVFGYKPDEGRILIYSDYAQLELRTICAIVGCTLMEELFRSGEDLHGYTAKMVFGEDWTPTHRQISKTYNFNLLVA